MQFGGPDNRFLVASGLVGDGGVVVFERVGQGVEFVQVANSKDVPNLTSFVFSLPSPTSPTCETCTDRSYRGIRFPKTTTIAPQLPEASQ